MSRKNIVKNIIGGLVLVGLVFWVRSCFPPSQRSIVRQFERNREVFERVVAMLGEDTNVGAVSPSGVRCVLDVSSGTLEQAGISTQRYQEYLRLLKKAGAGSVTRYEEEILFPVGGYGFGMYGWVVFIAYRQTEPVNVVSSLRNVQPGGPAAKSGAYCPIVNNWYVRIIY